MNLITFWKASYRVGFAAILLTGALLLSACQEASLQSGSISLPLANEAVSAENAPQDIVASTMRLLTYEGDISIKNLVGSEITPTEDMQLQNGYTVSTAAASYAYISLDENKAIKLDGLTEFSVRQKGDQLEVLLLAGQLYYDVAAPLADSEVMNIRTSNMVTGIRGTSGFLMAAWNARIEQQASALLTGAVEVSIREVDGSITTQDLQSGYIEYYRPYDTSLTQTIQVLPLLEGDHIPAFVAEELLQNPENLAELASNLGLSSEELTTRLQTMFEEGLVQEQATQAQRQELAQQAQANTQAHIQTQGQTSAQTGSSQNQIFGGVTEQDSQENSEALPPTPSTNTSSAPHTSSSSSPIAPATSSSASASSSSSTPASSSSSTPVSSSSSTPVSSSSSVPASSSSVPASSIPVVPPTDPSVTTLTGNVTLAQIAAAFNQRADITTVVLDNATVTDSGTLNIASGKTLQTQNNVTLSGELEVQGAGNFVVESGTLNAGSNELSFEGTSAQVKSGALLQAGTMQTKSMSLVNAGSIALEVLQAAENSNIENTGTLTLSKSSSGALTLEENAQLTNRGNIVLTQGASMDSALELKGIFVNEAGATVSTAAGVKVEANGTVTNRGTWQASSLQITDTGAQFLNSGTLTLSVANPAEPVVLLKGTFETSVPLTVSSASAFVIDDASATLNQESMAQIIASANLALTDNTGSYAAPSAAAKAQVGGKTTYASDLQEIVNYAGLAQEEITLMEVTSLSASLNLPGTLTLNGGGFALNAGAHTLVVPAGANITFKSLSVTGTGTVLQVNDTGTLTVSDNTRIEKTGAGGFALQMNPTSATLHYSGASANYIKSNSSATLMADLAGTPNATAQANANTTFHAGYYVLISWV